MKKFFTYILSFYILFSAVVPCSVFDDCEEEQQTAQTADTNTEKQCGNNCSPLSTCCSAPQGLIDNSNQLIIETMVFNNSPSYNDFYCSSKSEYYSTLFQPPRSC